MKLFFAFLKKMLLFQFFLNSDTAQKQMTAAQVNAHLRLILREVEKKKQCKLIPHD